VIFNSLTFVVFFVCVLGLHSLPLPWRLRKFDLLIASYLFYAAWSPPFVILIWVSTLVDWFAARGIAAARTPRRRRAWLAVSLAGNLGLLGYFKYGGFLLDNFTALLAQLGVHFQAAAPGVVLPVGISFYTFQTLSYTLDVYRGQTRPWPSFLDYALFVTFFPQLVAGPIVRAVDFLPQCIEPKRATRRQLGWGLHLMVLGLFEKIVLADALLAPVADRVFSRAASANFLSAWTGTAAFAGQIFFDFAGYSTCAIGAALCLGFALPDNFRFPYAAVGFSDFWRRWHITLSSWLRDYLYIPLGGNRRGNARTLVNLSATMFLGGLWHGADWRFVVWGLLHGVYLVAERLARALLGERLAGRSRRLRLPLALLTFFLVCLTWVFFRAQSFADAFLLLGAMFGAHHGGLHVPAVQRLQVAAVMLALLAGGWLLRDASLEHLAGRTPAWLRVAAVAAMLLSFAFVPGNERAFIYFQF